MIDICINEKSGVVVQYAAPNTPCLNIPDKFFKGDYLETLFLPQQNGGGRIVIGMGEERLGENEILELTAKAMKMVKEKEIPETSVDVSFFVHTLGCRVIERIVQGIYLGLYAVPAWNKQEKKDYRISLAGIEETYREECRIYIERGAHLAEGICFARDVVNTPGNLLRPKVFADAVMQLLEDTETEVECIDYGKLCEMKMEGLVHVGKSSKFKPCLLIMRYRGDKESKTVRAFVGKGVTCDTGGYCLKPASSMAGIKGDMAGGAAAAGAVYALAKNKVKTNVTGIIPICENRISDDSMLPGDVIGSYGGKKVEILNTDAEGRLILADAVSYAVREEHASEMIDIATLTGAVVNLLGFSIAGVLSDDEKLYESFSNAFEKSGERYLRIPYYKEHEKMIQSEIADIKNMGESYCGTITAGLFIRAFAESRPWLHIDIAGTAWVEQPVFEYQSAGATGAGVTTLYYLGEQSGKRGAL